MRKAFRRRPDDFQKRRILARIYTNRKDLLIEEYRWLQMIKPEEIKKRYYNLHTNFQNQWWTDERSRMTTIEKMTTSMNALYATERGKQIKKQIAETLKISPTAIEARKKARAGAIAYIKKNGGPPNKGIPMSQEQKTLLSKIRKGRKLGPNKNTKAPYTKIEVLQQQGYNEREIAELLGVTTTAVYNTIRRYGGTPTKKTIKAPYDKIKSLWIQGYNKTAIAKICGVTREAIRNSIRRHEAVK